MRSTNIDIPVNFDEKKVNNELTKLGQKLQDLSAKQQPLIDKSIQLKSEIVKATAEADRYGQAWKNGVAGADTDQMNWLDKVRLLKNEYNATMLEIEKIDNKMLPIQEKMSQIKLDPAAFYPAKEEAKQVEDAVAKTADETKKVDKEAKKVSSTTSKVEKNTKQTERNVRNTSGATRTLASTGNDVAKAFERFGKRIANVGLSVFVFSVLSKGLTKVREQLSSMLSTNAAFTSSMNDVKSNLYTAFQPIYEACLPAINALASALATVTKYIAVFTNYLFGKSASASQKSAQNMYALANATDSTAKSTKKATKELSKEAKEAEKTFASFDEIQQLTTNSETDIQIPEVETPEDASGGNGVGSGMFQTDFSDMDEFVKKLDAIEAVVKRIGKQFQKGWKLEAAKADTEQLNQHLESIKKSYNEIFTDPKVQQAAVEMLDKLSYNAGRNAGAFYNVGVSCGNLVFGGIDKYLDENKDRLKDKIVNMWGIVGRTSDIITDWNVAVSDIVSGVFNDDTSQQIAANLIAIGVDATTGMQELCGDFSNDILSIITAPFVDNKDEIEEAIKNTLGPIEAVTGTVKDAVQDLSDKVNECYDKYLSPALSDIKESWSDLCGKFTENYNLYMKPVFDKFEEKLKPFYDDYIKPLVEKLEPFFEHAANKLEFIWKGILEPLLSFISEIFWPLLALILSYIMDGVENDFKYIFENIGYIMDELDGFCEFLEGVFTGDIDKAIEGIKKIFKAKANEMISYIETIVNNAISAINKLISAINNISGEVGIPAIPSIQPLSIPRLAKGAVIPPNKEFLAVLGDQKNGTNIETPLATMIDAFKAALSEGGYGSVPIKIEFTGNLAQLGRVLNPVITQEQTRIGNSMISTGGMAK